MTTVTDTMTTGWFGMMLVVMGLLLTPTRGLAASRTTFTEPQATADRATLCESDWSPPGRGCRELEEELETELDLEESGGAGEGTEGINEDEGGTNLDELEAIEDQDSDSEGHLNPSARTKRSSKYPARAPSS